MTPENYNTDEDFSRHLLCESNCSVCAKIYDRLRELTVREPQPDDQYYPLINKVTPNRVWFTEDVIKMVMQATYRNATDTADVEYIYRELGLDFTSTRTRHVPVTESGSLIENQPK